MEIILKSTPSDYSLNENTYILGYFVVVQKRFHMLGPSFHCQRLFLLLHFLVK